ncbi:MAG TPA: TolC family protein [Verrucomicrobiae bacterium]
MSARWKTWLLLCAAGAVAGCAHYQPQPLSPAQTAAEFERRQLTSRPLKDFLAKEAGQPPAQWPLAKWDINSLTLAAFYYHPDLAVARAQWRVAQAGITTAGARPNPSVTFTPAYDNQIPNNPSPWIFPVTFDIPLEIAGKHAKRIAEAEQAAESARWNYVSAAWQIRSGVRAALLEYGLAGRRAELLQKQFAAQSEMVKLMQGRFKAGAVARTEVTTVQIALSKTQQDLNDAQSKRSEARSRLAQAIGVPLEALDGVKLQFDFSAGTNRLSAREARAIALRSRADVLGALADYAAAEADLRLQVARQYPDLHLGPGYAWNSGNAGDNQWSLGATIELPILDQNQGPIAEATARRKLSAAKFAALQAQVSAEIDRAAAGVQVAREQLETGRKLIAAQHQQQEFAEAQFKAGAGERLDVLAAQVEAGSAAVAQLDNEIKLQTALGALEDAVQQPSQNFDVLKIITSQMEPKQSKP